MAHACTASHMYAVAAPGPRAGRGQRIARWHNRPQAPVTPSARWKCWRQSAQRAAFLTPRRLRDPVMGPGERPAASPQEWGSDAASCAYPLCPSPGASPSSPSCQCAVPSWVAKKAKTPPAPQAPCHGALCPRGPQAAEPIPPALRVEPAAGSSGICRWRVGAAGGRCGLPRFSANRTGRQASRCLQQERPARSPDQPVQTPQSWAGAQPTP